MDRTLALLVRTSVRSRTNKTTFPPVRFSIVLHTAFQLFSDTNWPNPSLLIMAMKNQRELLTTSRLGAALLVQCTVSTWGL